MGDTVQPPPVPSRQEAHKWWLFRRQGDDQMTFNPSISLFSCGFLELWEAGSAWPANAVDAHGSPAFTQVEYSAL